MRTWLLSYLKCPACPDAPVRVARTDESHPVHQDGERDEIVVTGVLECVACRERYPILAEAPRMVPVAQLTPEERDVLGTPRRPASPGPGPIDYSREQIAAMVSDRIMADYGRPVAGPGLRRAQADIAYQKVYEENRVYQMRLLRRLIGRAPSLVVDVGGGRGGNLLAASKAFDFDHGIVLDLDAHWPPVYRTGDRKVAYVRADATKLPLRSNCADLAISSFLLEHVRPWQSIVLELRRVAAIDFVAFGPNPAFPYESGHIEAPLAHTLPLPLGAMAACLWGLVSGNRRSYRRAKEILAGMSYVSSRRYYSFCRQQGIPAVNIFPDVMKAWAESGSSRRGAFLARHPRVLRTVGGALVACGLEPNIYSLLVRTQGA